MIVKNTTPGTIFTNAHGKALLLFSGINEIPDKEYKALRPHLQFDLDNGRIVEVNVAPAGKDGDEVREIPFQKLPIEKRKQLVADCVAIDTLESWLVADSDNALHLVIQKRIDEIKNYSGEADK